MTPHSLAIAVKVNNIRVDAAGLTARQINDRSGLEVSYHPSSKLIIHLQARHTEVGCGSDSNRLVLRQGYSRRSPKSSVNHQIHIIQVLFLIKKKEECDERKRRAS